ncbi:MAG: OmpA family protein [Deltaproteobacteria bacterium]
MNMATKIWNKINRYLVPGALGIFMVYGVASTHMAPQSEGAEMESGMPGYEVLAASTELSPYSPELKDIFFNENSYRIREDAKEVLKENSEVLKTETDTYVVIEAYCNAGEQIPENLGVLRAESVKNYVVQQGIDPDRIITANKCNAYDMKLSNTEDSIGLDSRVHFVALDELAEDRNLALNK